MDFDELHCSSEADQSPNNGSEKQEVSSKEIQNDTSMARVMDKFTEEELLTLIIKDKNNKESLFCDQGNSYCCLLTF